jgi:hypothetical protein
MKTNITITLELFIDGIGKKTVTEKVNSGSSCPIMQAFCNYRTRNKIKHGIHLIRGY